MGMKCCVKCFKSKQINSIIKSLDNIGECDFCRSRSVNIYDLDHDEGLDKMFNDILSVFRLGEELIADGYPSTKLISIKDEFEKRWNIFNNLNSAEIQKFLEELLKKRYPHRLDLLVNQVGIIEWMNEIYLKENRVLKSYEWYEFDNHIKYINRFYSNHINLKILKDYIESRLTTYMNNEIFYRARISNTDELNKTQIGAPPPKYATSGRANSEGISHLYLASDINTVVKEIRPNHGDIVYIGKFPINNSLKLVDFRLLNKLDVFEFTDPVRYAVNLDAFDKMSEAISKPIRSGESKLDYLSTQFIVDFIKSLNITESAGYQGIIYESTLSNSGYNMMLFESERIQCTDVQKHTIESLNYERKLCV